MGHYFINHEKEEEEAGETKIISRRRNMNLSSYQSRSMNNAIIARKPPSINTNQQIQYIIIDNRDSSSKRSINSNSYIMKIILMVFFSWIGRHIPELYHHYQFLSSLTPTSPQQTNTIFMRATNTILTWQHALHLIKNDMKNLVSFSFHEKASQSDCHVSRDNDYLRTLNETIIGQSNAISQLASFLKDAESKQSNNVIFLAGLNQVGKKSTIQALINHTQCNSGGITTIHGHEYSSDVILSRHVNKRLLYYSLHDEISSPSALSDNKVFVVVQDVDLMEYSMMHYLHDILIRSPKKIFILILSPSFEKEAFFAYIESRDMQLYQSTILQALFLKYDLTFQFQNTQAVQVIPFNPLTHLELFQIIQRQALQYHNVTISNSLAKYLVSPKFIPYVSYKSKLVLAQDGVFYLQKKSYPFISRRITGSENILDLVQHPQRQEVLFLVGKRCQQNKLDCIEVWREQLSD